MRINIYGEELTDRIEIITKHVNETGANYVIGDVSPRKQPICWRKKLRRLTFFLRASKVIEMNRKGISISIPAIHDAGTSELRRLIGLIGADVDSRAAPICKFIRAALMAGKSPTEIVVVLKAHVMPLRGDTLKSEDLLPAYVRMGLIGRPRTERQKSEKITDVVENILKSLT